MCKKNYNINSERRIIHIKKEDKFEISYEEFFKLDSKIITSLIETKIDKKLKTDYRQIVDRIPIDKAHTITREEIDRFIMDFKEL